MRVHTNATEAQMRDTAKGLPVFFHTLTEHGSRTHARSFEVRLEGSGGRNNTGLYGAGDYSGATWDEWGAWMARVFRLDPTSRMGGTAANPTYADAADFHFQTGHRFRADGMPADTHARHRWVYQGVWGDHGTAGDKCGKCGAARPSHRQIIQHRATA